MSVGAVRGPDIAAQSVSHAAWRLRLDLRAFGAGSPRLARTLVEPKSTVARTALVVGRALRHRFQHAVRACPGPRRAHVVVPEVVPRAARTAVVFSGAQGLRLQLAVGACAAPRLACIVRGVSQPRLRLFQVVPGVAGGCRILTLALGEQLALGAVVVAGRTADPVAIAVRRLRLHLRVLRADGPQVARGAVEPVPCVARTAVVFPSAQSLRFHRAVVALAAPRHAGVVHALTAGLHEVVPGSARRCLGLALAGVAEPLVISAVRGAGCTALAVLRATRHSGFDLRIVLANGPRRAHLPVEPESKIALSAVILAGSLGLRLQLPVGALPGPRHAGVVFTFTVGVHTVMSRGTRSRLVLAAATVQPLPVGAVGGDECPARSVLRAVRRSRLHMCPLGARSPRFAYRAVEPLAVRAVRGANGATLPVSHTVWRLRFQLDTGSTDSPWGASVAVEPEPAVARPAVVFSRTLSLRLQLPVGALPAPRCARVVGRAAVGGHEVAAAGARRRLVFAAATVQPLFVRAVGGADRPTLPVPSGAGRFCLHFRTLRTHGPRFARTLLEPVPVVASTALVVGRALRLRLQLPVGALPGPRCARVVGSVAVGQNEVVSNGARCRLVFAACAVEPLPLGTVGGAGRTTYPVLRVARRLRLHLSALCAGSPRCARAVVEPVPNVARAAVVGLRAPQLQLEHAVGALPAPRRARVVGRAAVGRCEIVSGGALGCFVVTLPAVEPLSRWAVGGGCVATLPVPCPARRLCLHLRALRASGPQLALSSVEPVPCVAGSAVVFLGAPTLLLEHAVGTRPAPRRARVVGRSAVGRHKVVPGVAHGCLVFAPAAGNPLVGGAVGGTDRATESVLHAVRRSLLHVRALGAHRPRVARVPIEPVPVVAGPALVVSGALALRFRLPVFTLSAPCHARVVGRVCVGLHDVVPVGARCCLVFATVSVQPLTREAVGGLDHPTQPIPRSAWRLNLHLSVLCTRGPQFACAAGKPLLRAAVRGDHATALAILRVVRRLLLHLLSHGADGPRLALVAVEPVCARAGIALVRRGAFA